MDNLLSLQGKHILVTGASSGMGKVFAQMAAAQGARVSLLARNEERLKVTLESLEGEGHDFCTCDLTEDDQLTDIVNKIDQLDGIVLCAGINDFVPVKFIKQEKISKMFQTNYFSQLILVQKLLKKKLINKGASIVFISSISSMLGVQGTLLYASSKGAINSAVRVLASELANQRIRVNAICPGIVKTEMLSGTNVDEDVFTKQEALYPLGLGTPKDVGGAVLFHLSDASRWLTGQCMIMDGGFTLN
ncbi:MAG: SDR family oxidoreductase [Bacteroidaceae bacterium]|nr:SDR family oxidoreductase [Bacteroidaceae bacterium]